MFNVNGLSNGKGNGAGVILKGLNVIVLEYSLKFNFKVTNNQVEYEVLVVGLQLGKQIGAQAFNIRNDLQLIITQMRGEYEIKEPLLVKYAQVAKRLLDNFDYNLQRILREKNN